MITLETLEKWLNTPVETERSKQITLNQPLPAMLAIYLFGHKSVLTQTEMSHSQSLKPLHNQQKSA